MLKNVKSMLAVRSKSLEDQKSECKKYPVRMKKARLEENEKRKRWMKKKQAFSHGYGITDEDEETLALKECLHRSRCKNRARFFVPEQF